MKPLFMGYDANGRKICLDFEYNPHMHAIGATRTGKSKLLEWMIRQHIRNSEGLCLIDPHGTLYEDIVKWCAYHWLDKEIILLNPSEGDRIVGFNPFKKSEAELSVQIDNQIAVILRAWGAENTNETPSLEGWLFGVLDTMLEKDQTIVAAEYLIDFFEPEIREYLTSNLSQQIARSDWMAASKAKTPRQFYLDNMMVSVKNRLRRFLVHPQIMRFMGMRERNIDIGEIMEEGKILLVNLKPSDYLSRENSHLFGALLVYEFFLEAFRRKRTHGEKPTPFYLYIDEFQNFVKTPDIGDMLDQVGKYGLRLILSHQRLGQIERENKDIIDAIFTNVRNRVIFGGLTDETAEYIVRNCFVNQLDLREIKKAIYQTKFWPVYGRDMVYSKAHGYSSGTAGGIATSGGVGSVYRGGEGWFGDMFGSNLLTTSDISVSASNRTNISADSDIESMADIPVFYPVPYEELTSYEFWDLDEQVWRMAEAIKAQLLRHCFIQIPGEPTQPMLVPFVREFPVFESTFLEFQSYLNGKFGALLKEEVDMLMEQERAKLKQQALLALSEGQKPEGMPGPDDQEKIDILDVINRKEAHIPRNTRHKK